MNESTGARARVSRVSPDQLAERGEPRVRTHPRIAAGLPYLGKECRHSHPPNPERGLR